MQQARVVPQPKPQRTSVPHHDKDVLSKDGKAPCGQHNKMFAFFFLIVMSCALGLICVASLIQQRDLQLQRLAVHSLHSDHEGGTGLRGQMTELMQQTADDEEAATASGTTATDTDWSNYECIGWKAQRDCSPDGGADPSNDRACNVTVHNGESGYCQTGSSFHMIETPPGSAGLKLPDQNIFCGVTMVQHDPQRGIVFLHRNQEKLSSENREKVWGHIQDFRMDEVSLEDYDVRGANGGRYFPQFKRCYGKDIYYENAFTVKPIEELPFAGLEQRLLNFVQEAARIDGKLEEQPKDNEGENTVDVADPAKR
ncbi:hypothetical protein PF010_g18822 [Phytophthora fragariae]|uniref:Uncharacterized protein n=1 Tax=Phytophthora fragariae TaxID=53985 RepID=A0A6A3SJH8_9STRA|nr:hypothetical protein PF010_g18822 [Phytophthora fragariae]KAE9117424.1 hypothetical protein PF006_g18814 [Phytophthora fragariae]